LTRALVDGLVVQGVQGATLLDIGGGVGPSSTSCSRLARSVRRGDASSAYMDAARKESDRRGLGGRVTYHHGVFVALAPSVPLADIVTLDRVLNVYPDWDRLATLSADGARRLYGIVVPRDRAFRFVIRRSTCDCGCSGSAFARPSSR
jgi:2-polyprenyl-3-methyl-5-hydroxy-6-metoxy-1,4-benzoquinol methylase